jgi:hypothetical protein
MVTGAPVRSAPAILDGNQDGRLDLFVQSTDGSYTENPYRYGLGRESVLGNAGRRPQSSGLVR